MDNKKNERSKQEGKITSLASQSSIFSSRRSHHLFAAGGLCLSSLAFIHTLQTELSREMNAFEQQPQPTNPQGFPARRTITASSQISSHVSDPLPEGRHAHRCRRTTHLYGDHRQQISVSVDNRPVPMPRVVWWLAPGSTKAISTSLLPLINDLRLKTEVCPQAKA
jgi:hypothetical protein